MTTVETTHPSKPIVFKGSPDNVTGLVFAGIDVVTLANNHVMDYMLPGLQETQLVLSENNIGGTYPEDMMNLMRQAVGIINHLGSGNHKDLHNKRSLEIPERYEVSTRRLPRLKEMTGFQEGICQF